MEVTVYDMERGGFHNQADVQNCLNFGKAPNFWFVRGVLLLIATRIDQDRSGSIRIDQDFLEY
jgi:hypothetical protein